jgi:hypothetical protein
METTISIPENYKIGVAYETSEFDLIFLTRKLEKTSLSKSPYPWHQDRQIDYYEGVGVFLSEPEEIFGIKLPSVRRIEINSTALKYCGECSIEYDEKIIRFVLNSELLILERSEYYMD